MRGTSTQPPLCILRRKADILELQLRCFRPGQMLMHWMTGSEVLRPVLRMAAMLH